MTQNNQDSKALALVQTMDETALTNILIKDSTLKLDLNYIKIMKEKHSKLPKEQFIDFFYKAQITGADPRIGQVHLITFLNSYQDEQGNWKKRLEGSPVFNYLFLIQKAEETGKLDGFESYTETVDGIKYGVAKVYRKDFSRPVIVRCSFDEFAKTNKEGGLLKMWKTMPEFMIEKCALANAIRRAFPSLAGIYIEEEMQNPNQVDPEKVIDVTPEKKPPVVKTSKETKPKIDASEKLVNTAKEKISNAKEQGELDEILKRIDEHKTKKNITNKQYDELVMLIDVRAAELTPSENMEINEDEIPDFNDEGASNEKK